MNRHGSMNRIFRLVWNESLNAYVPAAETARGRRKNSKRGLITAVSMLTAGIAQAAPTGGQVTAGNGTITQAGGTTTIQQSSQNLAINWQSFNVGSQQTVDFVQPNSSAIAVNQILSTNGSVILGHLNANGQVYLINPNGVLFGNGAEVNVGGLVASTLAFDDGTLGDGTKRFSGSGSGSVVNEGTLSATSGGSIALLGNRVSNNGVISAQLGTVALAAGSAATLTFRGTNLVSLQIDRSVLNSVAANGGLIRADGGQVLMTAGAQKALLASVVNNTGVIEARTLENHEGTITLLGGMSDGTVNVAGTLDASAPTGGHGGSIETSAAHVEISNAAKVTTAAAMGLSGTWLIDPTDFTISAGSAAQSSSGIGATTLQNELASGNVSIVTSNAGSQNGDINVDAPVSWSANKLALTAANDVNVNAVMTASGSASLDLAPASNNVNMGFNPDGSFAGQINFSGSGVLRMNVNGTLEPFTVINSLGTAADATGGAMTLQGLAATANLSGNYVLGSNIDASATSGWNACSTCSASLSASHYGFTPIGSSQHNFTGTFDGLGHTISGLTVSRPDHGGSTSTASAYDMGLFGYGSAQSTVRNVGMQNVSILGGHNVGGLMGWTYGSVSNSFSTGTVTGEQSVGGLVGTLFGSVTNSYSSTTVGGRVGAGNYNLGGLAGQLAGSIVNSHATGSVSGGSYVGGLVGNVFAGNITNSYAIGSVSAAGYHNDNGVFVSYVGGLVGYGKNLTITASHATGNVSGGGTYGIGGLVGFNYGNTNIDQSYATGTVSGGAGSSAVGGLVGSSVSGAITNSYTTGSVTGGNNVGGLVGQNQGSIATSYSTGTVSGSSQVGGLVGSNLTAATIATSYATGTVSGAAYAGGLVGQNQGAIATSYATGAVSGGSGVSGTGGLVGNNAANATIATSYATGAVTGDVFTGGLVGVNDGSVATSYATGAVTGSSRVGGLTGNNGGAGSISTSFATGSVTAGRYAGGLTGSNYGAINNTYATGNVVATGYNVGGLVGINFAGTISNSYATGMVSGSSYVGGLVGAQVATVTNSFYLSSANPGLTGFGGSGFPDAPGSVMGLTSAQLQSHANFISATTANGNVNPGWDFGSTWFMYEGHTTPLLQVFMTPVTVSGTITQTYKGGAYAPSIGALTYSITPDFSQIFGSVTLSGNAIGAKNVGTYTYTPGGIYSDQLGYMFTFASSTLTITPATVTVTGSTASKVYDGNTAAPLTGGTLVGLFGNDAVTLTQSGTFASKNAGSGIAVTASDSLSGADANDYILVEPTGITGTITPATLTVTGTSVGSKVYNGTASASLTGGTLVGVISGDSVTLDQSGSFTSSSPGSSIAVIVTDSLSGANAGDYTLVEPTGLAGTILPAPSPPVVTSGPNGSVQAAINARTQIVENFIYPQLGANPQVINASSTITPMLATEEASGQSTGLQQPIAVNVSMKIGATGTLKVENGGLRLPSNLVVGNE